MKPIILGFAGSIASGKSTLSIEVAKSLGWKRVSFGDYVRTVAKCQGLGESREVLQGVGACLINHGVEQFCKSVLEQVNWKPGQALIVDGIRHAEVLLTLRRLVAPSKLLLIFLMVDEPTREIRLIEKGLSHSEELQLIEVHSTEVQVHKVLPEMADLIVDNTSEIKEIVEEILRWINQLSKEQR